MNKHLKKSDWKSSLKEIRDEYRTITRPCLAMSKEKFNELMDQYKIIKPSWNYHKRKKYLQWIIDRNEERNTISRDIIYTKHSNKRYLIGLGAFCSKGSHHVLEWLDDELDNILDLMGPIDLS